VKTQPNPSDREVLAGLVERVTYQNAENGFFVIGNVIAEKGDGGGVGAVGGRLPRPFLGVLPPRRQYGRRGS
jgi:hypothetical protein